MYWLIAYVVLSYMVSLYFLGKSEQKDGHIAWDKECQIIAAVFILGAPITWWLWIWFYIEMFLWPQLRASDVSLNPLVYIGRWIERFCICWFPIK